MKIALCSSYVPFIRGGYRNIVDWLAIELEKRGHAVEIIYFPEVDLPDLLLPQMAALRWLDLTESADRIICFRPQSHLIRHPHKVLWFIHHIRVYYDLWDSPYRFFPEDEKHLSLRKILHSSDTAAIKEAKNVFTNSQIVSDRLKKYNDIESEVLYPPIINHSRFYNDYYGDEIVFICRMEHHKRQHLLVEAMRYTKSGVKLRLCGVGGSSHYYDEMIQSIQTMDSNVQNRIIFEYGWLSEENKVKYIAKALAAVYPPLDEDSYGYPSLEASYASKAILTTTDSGGVLELVKDGYNGYVCEPEPQKLAEAMDRLFLDKKTTELMGANALKRVSELKISWDHVIERLIS